MRRAYSLLLGAAATFDGGGGDVPLATAAVVGAALRLLVAAAVATPLTACAGAEGVCTPSGMSGACVKKF